MPEVVHNAPPTPATLHYNNANGTPLTASAILEPDIIEQKII